jgi:hypothetical protein
MKILGIGNAIVDVICKIDENFLIKNNLTFEDLEGSLSDSSGD